MVTLAGGGIQFEEATSTPLPKLSPQLIVTEQTQLCYSSSVHQTPQANTSLTKSLVQSDRWAGTMITMVTSDN